MTKLQEYEVKINRTALADLDDLYEYVSAGYSKETAQEIRQRIKDAIRSLRELPKRQRIFFLNLRRLIVGKYYIFYEVNAHTVTVRAILHSSMDVVSHLKGR